MTKRRRVGLTVCSTAFASLGRAQAKALGCPDLPIAIVPHPFGIRTRDQIREVAVPCVDEIARLVRETVSQDEPPVVRGTLPAAHAPLIEVPNDIEEVNRFFLDRRWSDGLPVIPPTEDRVERMLHHSHRNRDEIVATIAPGFGAATVERIAINAVLAGCEPEYLPLLIAGATAVAAPEFNLRAVQATTNPAAVWLIVNGPIAQRLGVNSGNNCLGQGVRSNATLGRALRLMLQNIGGALPGEMDRATQGQPAKYTFCCAENEAANPWEPLHVERGFARDCSTVTVVGALSTLNMNSHAKDAGDLLRVIADTMAYPVGSDHVHGGAPWIVFSPEHAHILQRDGLSKTEVKRRLWEQSKLSASRVSAKDLKRVQNNRRAELGNVVSDTLLPISVKPEDISILVAGGPGTHSVFVPVSGNSRSVTREVICN